jgi:hypothetical protein
LIAEILVCANKLNIHDVYLMYFLLLWSRFAASFLLKLCYQFTQANKVDKTNEDRAWCKAHIL